MRLSPKLAAAWIGYPPPYRVEGISSCKDPFYTQVKLGRACHGIYHSKSLILLYLELLFFVLSPSFKTCPIMFRNHFTCCLSFYCSFQLSLDLYTSTCFLQVLISSLHCYSSWIVSQKFIYALIDFDPTIICLIEFNKCHVSHYLNQN